MCTGFFSLSNHFWLAQFFYPLNKNELNDNWAIKTFISYIFERL